MVDLLGVNCDKGCFLSINSTFMSLHILKNLYLFLQHLILHKKEALKVNQYFLNISFWIFYIMCYKKEVLRSSL